MRAATGGTAVNDVETLIAERQITRQLTNYCRALDRCDTELGYAVFHADAKADYGEIYQGLGRGFIDWVMQAHTHVDHHLHRISNVLIEVDGDRAGSETYVEAVFRLSGDAVFHEMRTAGRYLDRWEKRSGNWAISERIYVHTTDSIRLLDSAPRPITGTRDAHDPSYSVLSSPAVDVAPSAIS
jgi:hypothetical protein